MFCTLMLQLLFLFLLFNDSILQHINPSTPHWDYQREGPDTWKRKFDECEGESQSPIDIQTSHVKYDPQLHPLSLKTYTTNVSSYLWNFTHNGHTIIAYPPPIAHLSMSGAYLPEIFYLIEFHFHWGYNAYQGSEHTINGIKYPLEIHFLHQGRYTHSMAILSILFDLERDDNPYINDLLTVLNQTKTTSMSVEYQIDISRLFPKGPLPHFYYYNGSLTYPPCTEDVIWIILARPVPISPCQLEVFVGNSVPFNFRPQQKLNSRKVLANFRSERNENSQDEEDENNHHSSGCIKQISIFFLLFILIIAILKKYSY